MYIYICYVCVIICVCVCVYIYLSIYIYIYIYWHSVGQWSGRPRVQSQVVFFQKLKNWYLLPPSLTQHYKVQIEVSRAMQGM